MEQHCSKTTVPLWEPDIARSLKVHSMQNKRYLGKDRPANGTAFLGSEACIQRHDVQCVLMVSKRFGMLSLVLVRIVWSTLLTIHGPSERVRERESVCVDAHVHMHACVHKPITNTHSKISSKRNTT